VCIMVAAAAAIDDRIDGIVCMFCLFSTRTARDGGAHAHAGVCGVGVGARHSHPTAIFFAMP
jgi:hypothetical protein